MSAVLNFFENPNMYLHPINTLEDTFTTTKHFINHPVEDLKSVFNYEKTNVQKFTKHPLDTITGGVTNDFKDVTKAIEKIPTEIKADVKAIGDQFDYFRTDLKKGATAVEQFVVKDIEPIAIDGYKLISGLTKGMIFLIERPQLVIGGVGSYVAMRWLNELKELSK